MVGLCFLVCFFVPTPRSPLRRYILQSTTVTLPSLPFSSSSSSCSCLFFQSISIKPTLYNNQIYINSSTLFLSFSFFFSLFFSLSFFLSLFFFFFSFFFFFHFFIFSFLTFSLSFYFFLLSSFLFPLSPFRFPPFLSPSLKIPLILKNSIQPNPFHPIPKSPPFKKLNKKIPAPHAMNSLFSLSFPPPFLPPLVFHIQKGGFFFLFFFFFKLAYVSPKSSSFMFFGGLGEKWGPGGKGGGREGKGEKGGKGEGV